MPTANTKTAAAKNAPATEAQAEVSQERNLEQELLELQAINQDLLAKHAELVKTLEKLELSQRVWVKEQQDGTTYKVGKTKAGHKKVSYYVAKATKDQDGKYVSGAWKLIIATDNGSGPQATAAQELLDSGERFIDLEAFEKTFVNSRGEHNSYWMQTSIQGQGKATANAPAAPSPEEVPDF